MSLERLPYFKFHCADYLLDTRALTQAQHGAYCLLIVNYYWDGCLPKSIDEIHALGRAETPEQKANVDFVLEKFFSEENGTFRHNRIEREREKLGEIVRVNSKAGAASAKARAQKPPRLKRVNGSPHGFDAFYAAYPKHVGRAKAEKAWIALNLDDALIARIMQAVEVQKKSAQWMKDRGAFIPHPASWLNGKRWEDEIKTVDELPDRYNARKAQM